MIRLVIGLAIIVCSIGFAAWFGIYVMLIGGIIELAEASKAEVVDSVGIAYGVAKILMAELAAVLIAVVGCVIGSAVLGK